MNSQDLLISLESLHKDLETLKPAIEHIDAARQITMAVKGIPQRHIDLINQVTSNDNKHKKELKDLFESELISITDQNKLLSNASLVIQTQVKEEIVLIATLKDSISGYYQKIDRINFPERLDKLDANVSGLMASIQASNSRLDNIERNITDKLKDLNESQKTLANMSLQSITKNQKNTNIVVYVCTFILALSIILVKILLK